MNEGGKVEGAPPRPVSLLWRNNNLRPHTSHTPPSHYEYLGTRITKHSYLSVFLRRDARWRGISLPIVSHQDHSGHNDWFRGLRVSLLDASHYLPYPPTPPGTLTRLN